MTKVLVTGGCGFIGTNLVRHILSALSDWSVVNLDLLTYAGNLENTAGLEDAYPGRYFFIRGDIADPEIVQSVFETHKIDLVLNLAAESHVDRSIESASIFIRTNVLGVQVLLDTALKYKVERLLHVSTDEVYGSLGQDGRFTEDLPLKPNSPYSASKAAADLLVRSYIKTYGLDAVITRCSNNYGPYQFPEKLIPLMIANALEEKNLPIYGDGRNVRDWIHVKDHCRGIVMVAQKGISGEAYNMGGNAEKENIEIVKDILRSMGKPETLIKFVKDRPGHDFRYAMDYSKIERKLGWKPAVVFEEGLQSTVDWYIQNRPWWERIRTGDYLAYYERMYGNR
jgi:dTDP-glucose 4,6-dehydratase